MNGYTKLFSSILDSTIWLEDDKTRLVWITMMAMADRDGLVMASTPGLADRAKVSLEDCLRALRTFQEPDQWSRTKEHGGRRIQEVDGGWLLLNHAKYRALMSVEDTREKNRIRQALWRDGHPVSETSKRRARRAADKILAAGDIQERVRQQTNPKFSGAEVETANGHEAKNIPEQQPQ